MKAVYVKPTKRFACYQIVSEDGVNGSLYLPSGYNQETIEITMIGPDHPDHAEELAKIKKKQA